MNCCKVCAVWYIFYFIRDCRALSGQTDWVFEWLGGSGCLVAAAAAAVWTYSGRYVKNLELPTTDLPIRIIFIIN